jgi:hypothetical protein
MRLRPRRIWRGIDVGGASSRSASAGSRAIRHNWQPLASQCASSMSLLSSSSGLSVLRNRNLSFYLSARFLGTLAVQMQSVAVGWQVYQITGSLFDLGLIGLAQFAPFLVLILWAGHVADRHDRRKIIVLCMLTQLVCSAAAAGLYRQRQPRGLAGVRGAGAVRQRARLHDAGLAGGAAQPGAGQGFRPGRRARFLDLPRRRHRRPGARRPAVCVRADRRLPGRGGAGCWRHC